MSGAKIRRLTEQCGEIEDQARRFERTFESMLPWLPARVNDFLDIGCGTGGIALHVARHYPGAVAHLMDGARQGVPQAWRTDGVAWRDVAVAVQAFARHGPTLACRAWPPDPGLTIPCELIFSICSWGHHYPIETYLALARRSLKPGGTLIVDLRVGELEEHGRAVLAQHFMPLASVGSSGKKYTRTVWRAPK